MRKKVNSAASGLLINPNLRRLEGHFKTELIISTRIRTLFLPPLNTSTIETIHEVDAEAEEDTELILPRRDRTYSFPFAENGALYSISNSHILKFCTLNIRGVNKPSKVTSTI